VPEGDSVRIAVEGLHAKTAGARVVRSDFRVPQHAAADLSGVRILGWDAYGKHLLCRFDNGDTLHTHFEMEGSWSVLGTGKRLPRAVEPDLRVALHLEDGRTAVGVKLPVVELLRTAEEHLVLGHLGPDILAPDFDLDEAVRRLAAHPDRPVVQALLDQKNLAGIGNLWANEVCFLRGLYPWRPVSTVELEPTVELARRMMRHCVQHRTGQTTTGDRREPHWVSGRYRKPCRRCGTPIQRRDEGPGPYERFTWWCPRCQPSAP
jgi:formamidopyrimidine-DNA glycosylase